MDGIWSIQEVNHVLQKMNTQHLFSIFLKSLLYSWLKIGNSTYVEHFTM